MNVGTILKTATSAVKSFAKTLPVVVKANSPAVLAGTAIVGAVAIAYTTYKCTPKYKEAIDEASTVDTVEKVSDGIGGYSESHTIERVEPTRKTKAKIFVKTMWPVLVAIIVTMTSIVMSHKISAKRIAMLSAAYTAATQKASEAAEKKAEEFIKDKLGSDAAEEYKEQVAKDKAEANEALAKSKHEKDGIIKTDGGDTLFYDYYSGQYFRASTGFIESKLETFNETNKREQEYVVSYNEFLDALGLNFIGMGNYIGWDMRNDGDVTVEFTYPTAYGDSVHVQPGGELPWIMKVKTRPVMIQ